MKQKGSQCIGTLLKSLELKTVKAYISLSLNSLQKALRFIGGLLKSSDSVVLILYFIKINMKQKGSQCIGTLFKIIRGQNC